MIREGYHPSFTGQNPLVFNFLIKKMSLPPFLSGNSKKRLTNMVSCDFMVLGHYTYRLVYIAKVIFLGNNDLFIDLQDRGEVFGEGGLTFFLGIYNY